MTYTSYTVSGVDPDGRVNLGSYATLDEAVHFVTKGHGRYRGRKHWVHLNYGHIGRVDAASVVWMSLDNRPAS